MRRALARALLVAGVLLSTHPAALAQENGTQEEPAAAEGAEATSAAEAPQGGGRIRIGDEELAGRVVNVLATLFQIPIAHNFEWGLGSTEEGFRYLLTARPRLPLHLAGEWMLVTTAFVRFHFIDDVLAPDGTGAGSFVGMGDTDVYALVTPPMLVEGLLFGVGPFLILPAGDLRFGSVNVGVGPGAAVTWQGYGVSLTLTVLHAFSFVDDETDYSQTQLIPTVSYVFDTGTAIVAQSETVYEWHSDMWVAPLSIGVTQVFSPGPFLRMNIGILGKWWPASPTAGPDWGVRVLTTLLFPELEDDEG